MAQTDPPRRTPSIVWGMLGLIVIAVFAAVVLLLRGHVVPGAVGPPPGSP